ncbi:histone-lysine N-methyltransferase PRDM9-like, partial [Clarias magur]
CVFRGVVMRSAGERRRSCRRSRARDPAPSQLCDDVKTETSDGETSKAPEVQVKKEETQELNISSHGNDLDIKPEDIAIKEEDPDHKDQLCLQICKSYFSNKCEVHGPPVSIPDTPVPDRATQTLPPGLETQESSIPDAGLGVFNKGEAVPVGAHFGPYQGELVDREEAMNSEYSWVQALDYFSGVEDSEEEKISSDSDSEGSCTGKENGDPSFASQPIAEKPATQSPPRYTAGQKRPLYREEDLFDSSDKQSEVQSSPTASKLRRGTRTGQTSHSSFQSPKMGNWKTEADPDTAPPPFRFRPLRTPGVQVDTTVEHSPLNLFQLFFSSAVVKQLCSNTNKYAAQNSPGKTYAWEDLCDDVKTETSDGETSKAPEVQVKKEETQELNISSHGNDLDIKPEDIAIKEEDPGVFNKEMFPVIAHFGPYQGELVDREEAMNSEYSLVATSLVEHPRQTVVDLRPELEKRDAEIEALKQQLRVCKAAHVEEMEALRGGVMSSAGDRRRSSRKFLAPDPTPSQLCEDVKTETSDGETSTWSEVCVKKEEMLELNICSHGDDLDTTPDIICVKEEDLDYKDQLYCEICKSFFFNKCEVHGSPLFIPDTSVPMEVSDRARQTLPPGLEIQESSIPHAGLGVFNKGETVPVGAHFGPYQGELVDRNEAMNSEYSWVICKSRQCEEYIDAKREMHANWMRYVNCGRNDDEQNLVAFQYRGQILYRCCRPIDPGQELLVWYEEEYAKDLSPVFEHLWNKKCSTH